MSTRTRFSSFIALSVTILFSLGCQQEAQVPPGDNSATDPIAGGRVRLPLIPGAKLEVLKSTLGPDFAVRGEGPPLCLAKTVDSHEIMAFINHDPLGGVNNVHAYVIGPRSSGDIMDELYRQTAMTLAKAVGIQNVEDFGAYAQIGVIKTRAGFPHNFRLETLYFSMGPDIPLNENSSQIPFKPGHVQRYFGVSPKIGADPPLKPIPKASLQQLEELLDGFSAVIRAGKDQILYTHEAETHTDFVQCSVNERGELIRIEAFAGRVKGDVSLAELNDQLWIKLSNLQYQNCDPERVIAFLKGPKLDYAAGDGRNINGVKFYLPLNVDSKRKLMAIYEER